MKDVSEKGFTLVEVLVALVIFSTAILGMMGANTQNLRAIQTAEQKQIAGIVADNQLILALHNETPVRVGVQQNSVEMVGRNWGWQIRTEATTQSGFLKLTITVREDNSEHVILSRIAYAKTS